MYRQPGRNVKVQLYLFNYATKVDLKGATEIDSTTLVSKTELATLSKLSTAVHDYVVKKTVYNLLVIKFKTALTKIPSTNGLITKT